MYAKKSLGQNFLINENIIQDILALFNFEEDDLVIEIGPGRGALTKYLKDISSHVICIEIDKDMIPILKKYESNHLEIINEDILQIDLLNLVSKYNYKHLYIIGNLPYYITSPILEKIIESRVLPNKMAFMVQKEVADRYSAICGTSDYGYMSLFLQYYYNIKNEISVEKNNFNPVPKVDSAVISLCKRIDVPDVDFDDYKDFLKEAFHLKRKTLKNNLSVDKWNKVSNVLEKNNISMLVRSEELSEDVIIKILKELKK